MTLYFINGSVYLCCFFLFVAYFYLQFRLFLTCVRERAKRTRKVELALDLRNLLKTRNPKKAKTIQPIRMLCWLLARRKVELKRETIRLTSINRHPGDMHSPLQLALYQTLFVLHSSSFDLPNKYTSIMNSVDSSI